MLTVQNPQLPAAPLESTVCSATPFLFPPEVIEGMTSCSSEWFWCLESPGPSTESCPVSSERNCTVEDSVVAKTESRSVVSDSLRPCGLYSSWDSPGQDTGVGSLSLLQGIFPTQGLNPDLQHCRRILSQLSHRGAQDCWSGSDTYFKASWSFSGERC